MTYNEDTKTLVASEGKLIKRKVDGSIYGNSITLGNTWYINNVKLDTPHIDIPEDFEEIDNPYILK